LSAYDPIEVDVDELKFLAERLRSLGPEILKAWRADSRALGEDIKADAAQRFGRSPSIAASGKVRTTRWGNVIVQFGGGDAWRAPIIENKGDGMVVHPVFGNKNGQSSTNLNGLPAGLHPALNANRDKSIAVLSAAINRGIAAADLGD
jgi:hypothetical protein